MKCIVCGNEIGNSRYCQMCGADNGVDNGAYSGAMYGGNSGYAYSSANILVGDQENNKSPDGTTVLSFEEMAKISKSDILSENNEQLNKSNDNIIPEYEKPKSKKEIKSEEKELKKSQQGYVNLVPFIIAIIALGILLILAVAVLIYYIFFGRKEYIEIMPEVSASIYIDDTANNQIISSEGEILSDLDGAEKVAQNMESALFLEESGELIHRYIDGKEKNLGAVTYYYANDNLTTIVCLTENEEKYNIDVWYDEARYSVENQLNNVNNVVLSDQKGYFAFLNEYEETYWEENERLDDGGENITIVHRDLYLVNGNGESKLIYSTEDNAIKINYVTNNGYIFFTEENKNGTYIIKDGEEKRIGYGCESIIYYEDIDQYIMLDTNGDMYYGVISSRINEAEAVATNIDHLIDIGGNQQQEGYENVGEGILIYDGGYSYSETPQIAYEKNESMYFIRPEYMNESVKVSETIDNITDIYSWNNEKVFFIEENKFGVISLVSREESEEDKDTYVETWSEYRLIKREKGKDVSVLADGSFLYINNENLYCYDDGESELLRKNIQNFCANDNSNGYMYVKNNDLYYSYGVGYKESADVYISEVMDADYMISNNHTVYYYNALDEKIFCVDMYDGKSELLCEDIKATYNETEKIIIIRERKTDDI